MHEEVEVLIADGGLVQHVIAVIMFVKLLAELLDALYLVHCFINFVQRYFIFLT